MKIENLIKLNHFIKIPAESRGREGEIPEEKCMIFAGIFRLRLVSYFGLTYQGRFYSIGRQRKYYNFFQLRENL